MKILGIETSCDETACGIVEGGTRLLSNVVATSMDLHAAYGGVVPEIAARSHIESITPVINESLDQAFPSLQGDRKRQWQQVDGIAVTNGAGLGGSLLIGVLHARTLAIIKKKPLFAINHVEGHIYANFLTETTLPGYQLPKKAPKFPMLGLIVSGGHSQLVLWRGHHDYTLLGQTHDDALGEAFDKVARILGLPYPGGPSIGIAAQKGDPFAFQFPKAKISTVSPALAELRRTEKEARRKDKGASAALAPYSVLPAPRSDSYDFSFSGLKTAVLRAAQTAIGEDHTFPSQKLSARLSEAQKADIAASFQRVAIETVVDKTVLAYKEFRPASIVIGGGVAASPELRRQLSERFPSSAKDSEGHTPSPLIPYTDPKLMTDNGAMIATLGCYKVSMDRPAADPYSLAIAPNLSM